MFNFFGCFPFLDVKLDEEGEEEEVKSVAKEEEEEEGEEEEMEPVMRGRGSSFFDGSCWRNLNVFIRFSIFFLM